MDDTLRLDLDVDGWRPTVIAERLHPAEYGLAVHESPWITTDPDDPSGLDSSWWVSDVHTGRRYAIGQTRDEAIYEAVNYLIRAAADSDRSVQDVLRQLRHPHTH